MSESTTMVKAGPKAALELLQDCYDAREPGFLWSGPGVGKSAIMALLAVRNSAMLIDERASTTDPTDWKGLPDIDRDAGVTKWLRPDFLPVEDAPMVIFMDELPQAPVLVQNALLQLILDRRIGNYSAPEQVRFFAAGNRVSDRAGAGRLTSAQANRYAMHIELIADHKEWGEWAIGAAVHAKVRAFINSRPPLLHQHNPALNEMAFPTPRSWHKLGNLIAAAERRGADEHRIASLAMGCVGESAGAEFSNYARTFDLLPDPAEILANPDTTAVPEDPGVLFAVAAILTDALRAPKDAKGTRDAVLRYALRMPLEFQVSTVIDCQRIDHAVANEPRIQKWLSEHSEIMVGEQPPS